MTKKRLPPPPVPADADLRGNEPPWDTMIDLAIEQFGVSRTDAERYVEQAKAQFRRLH